MTLWDDMQTEPLVAFDVVATIDDQLAFNRHVRATPAWKRREAKMLVAWLAAAPVEAILICASAGLIVAGTDCDLDAALDADARLWLFLKVLAALLFAEAIGFAIYYGLRWRGIEAAVRRIVAARPHVDAKDPLLHEPSSIGLHDAGYRSSNPSGAHVHAWAASHGYDETADHIFLMANKSFGFIIPKRDLPPATILAVRDILRAKLGSAETPAVAGPWGGGKS